MGIVRSGTQTKLRFPGKELLKDGDGVAGHVDGVEGFVGENGVVNFVFVFTTEGRLLEKHLVDQDTECPPVDGTAVALVHENLHELAFVHTCVGH